MMRTISATPRANHWRMGERREFVVAGLEIWTLDLVSAFLFNSGPHRKWIFNSKVDAIINEVNRIITSDSKAKILIFSNFQGEDIMHDAIHPL